MSWLTRIFKRNQGGIITEEMRQKGLEIRRQQSQIAMLEKQLQLKTHLEDLQQMITGGDDEPEDSTDKIFMNVVLQALSGGFNKPGSIPQDPQQQLGSFTDPTKDRSPKVEAIASALSDKIPKAYLDQLVKLTDSEVLSIRSRIVEKNLGDQKTA